jgi:DNA-binding response OmpR family regulator
MLEPGNGSGSTPATGKRWIIILSKDDRLASELKHSLNENGFNVLVSQDYRTIPQTFKTSLVKIIIMDHSGADTDGFQLCRGIRRKYGLPILVIVSGGHDEVIKALDSGADVCITRPVDTAELFAQVRALLRLTEAPPAGASTGEESYVVDNLRMDPHSHRVVIGDAEINLTMKEFDLLLLLVKKRGQVVRRQELLEQIWGYTRLESYRTIDTHICRLKKKIQPYLDWHWRFVTLRGLGYELITKKGGKNVHHNQLSRYN